MSLYLCLSSIIECSGIHRSLGTHISRVRSVTLDTLSWTPQVITALTSNAEVNARYEAHIAPPHYKPGPGDRRDVKQRFITAKYVERAFLLPGSSGVGVTGAHSISNSTANTANTVSTANTQSATPSNNSITTAITPATPVGNMHAAGPPPDK